MTLQIASAPVSRGITESIAFPPEYRYSRVLDELPRQGTPQASWARMVFYLRTRWPCDRNWSSQSDALFCFCCLPSGEDGSA
jgi:hypothetical protein